MEKWMDGEVNVDEWVDDKENPLIRAPPLTRLFQAVNAAVGPQEFSQREARACVRQLRNWITLN